MSKNNIDRKVIEIFIDEIEYSLLIIQFPKQDIEDKLSYLSREKGNVSKDLFEDLLISICLANASQLSYHIKNYTQKVNLDKLKETIVSCIIKYNPYMNPDNLVINRNGVIKLKENVTDESLRPLTSNKGWVSGNVITEDAPLHKSEEESFDESSFIKVSKWWERINKYIFIKKFKQNAVGLIQNKTFPDTSAYKSFVSTKCIIDSEELFEELDETGMTKKVTPSVLLNELYSICIDVNKVLDITKVTNEIKLQNKKNKPIKGKSTSQGKKLLNQGEVSDRKTFRDLDKKILVGLEDSLNQTVIGQKEAIQVIADSIQMASVGLRDPSKPLGSFLFAGRTGCGKTHLAKSLTKSLTGDHTNIIIIDCTEYTQEHDHAKLIGTAPGYIGYDNGGYLTNHMETNPFTVVLFDEIEKASQKVHDLMLQIMDEGRLTDGKGQQVYFNNAIIIMTSNVGVKEVDNISKTVGFGDVAILTDDKKDKAIDRAIKKKFRPEFINRLDKIVHFRTLDREDYFKIIDLELSKLKSFLKENNTDYKDIDLVFNTDVINHVYENGLEKDMGARPISRYIDKNVCIPLAKLILFSDTDKNASVSCYVEGSQICFDIFNPDPKEDSSNLNAYDDPKDLEKKHKEFLSTEPQTS